MATNQRRTRHTEHTEGFMREQTAIGHRSHAAQSSRSAGTSSGIHPEDQPYNTTNDLDLWEPPRTPSSARRYRPIDNPNTVIQVTDHRGQQPPIQRASRKQQQTNDPYTPVPQLPKQAQSRHNRHWLRGRHPLFYIGSVVIVAMLGWWAISGIISWAHVTLDDMHYGRP